MKLIPHRLTPDEHPPGIRSLVGFGTGPPALAHPVLYLQAAPSGLHLNAFRGEPAISGFDWHFTPTHSSSPGIATPVGSGLHYATDGLAAALPSGSGALFRLGFPPPSGFSPFSSPRSATHRLILQ